jgi:hypothetical protein
VTSKWIYKIKHAADDDIEKCKAIFVARGFSHKEGEYYDEALAPVAIRSVHRASIRYMRRSLMSTNQRKLCMGLSKHPGHGIPEQTVIL